jgi:hypothetical protein
VIKGFSTSERTASATFPAQPIYWDAPSEMLTFRNEDRGDSLDCKALSSVSACAQLSDLLRGIGAIKAAVVTEHVVDLVVG